MNQTELDVLFAQNFTVKNGKFIYCEDHASVVDTLRSLKIAKLWNHLFWWESEVLDLFNEHSFQKGISGFRIDNSHVGVSLCESLIAENGNVMLSSKQSSRRRLPVFPKVHIILADVSQLVLSTIESLNKFSVDNPSEIPSVLDLERNYPGQADINGNLVLNAEGPEEVYIILTDQSLYDHPFEFS